MTYSVLFESKALKKLYSFETELLKRIRRKTDELARNPRPSGVKKLVGENQSGYRIRVGDVRILYTIDDKDRIVHIFDIEPRDKAYKKR